MTTKSPADWTLGYCTNVHPGLDLAAIRENLERYAVPARVGSGSEMLGVGLWLPQTAVDEIWASGDPTAAAQSLGEFLAKRRLRPYTINGFPQLDFHQDVVKHAVYRPTWATSERLEYTQRLAEFLGDLMDAAETGGSPQDEPGIGSISTLPIGWPQGETGTNHQATEIGSESSSQHDSDDEMTVARAGQNLRDLAATLAQMESKTGRRIVVAIEPEPGCLLDTTDDVIEFFQQHLPEVSHRRHITVCHDVCHSAVMMEPQAEVLGKLASAGISIGKVQISSAIVADWQSMAVGRRREAIDQLQQFAEDRYLHQTGRRTATDQFLLSGDLPELIAACARDGDPVWGDQQWVVHFHVPIFLERFGHLTTSHQAVLDCLAALATPDLAIEFTGHLEIETYAWTVLPPAMRKRALADDIANEVTWLRRAILETA